MDPHKIITYTLMTEKAMDRADKENVLTFIVNRKANANQIREAVEKVYEVKVQNVNTQITPKGQKKAMVKLHPDFQTVDILTKMGVV